MVKIYRTAVTVLASLVCLMVLSIRPQAAEYKLGPGDHYDEAGNVVALNGSIIVRADGTAVSDMASESKSYTVLGNGTGGSSEIPAAQIIAGAAGTKSGSTEAAANASGSSTEAATATAITATAATAQAAATGNASENTAKTKTNSNTATAAGTGSIDTRSAAQTAKAAEISVPNYTVSGSGADAVYTFEGKKYRKSSLYGTQRLTGYAAEETGTSSTVSGKAAMPRHTAAAPSDIPLGTVIIVEGVSGPRASLYNGVYVVEDRGGAKLEAERMIDIFFGSAAEADAVTAAGWNNADIYIAEAVK